MPNSAIGAAVMATGFVVSSLAAQGPAQPDLVQVGSQTAFAFKRALVNGRGVRSLDDLRVMSAKGIDAKTTRHLAKLVKKHAGTRAADRAQHLAMLLRPRPDHRRRQPSP